MDGEINFNTLVRVAGSWSSFGSAFIGIMEEYGWSNLVIVSDIALQSCYYAASAINSALMSESLSGNFTVHWDQMAPSPNLEYMTGYLNDARMHGSGGFHCIRLVQFNTQYAI